MNRYNREKHEYLIDGKPATGVTSVISVLAKPQLIQWAANEAVKHVRDWIRTHEKLDGTELFLSAEKLLTILEEARTVHAKKKDSAAEHGTSTHSLVETYIGECLRTTGGKPILWEVEAIKKFTDWAINEVDHFLFSERQMYNPELFIAGTADFGAVMKDGKKLIGDFKTSSGVYGIDYFLQCAGYKLLAEGEGDEPYDGCVITRLGKDGSFDVYYSYDSKAEEEAFRACLTIYRIQATFKEFKKLPKS